MARKILVVDDMATNRLALKKMLSDEYDILEAADGPQALGALLKYHADISAVLLDILMPGMDGYEVLRKIRSATALSELPVIMITGSEDEETRVKSLSLGANDFVMKKYSAEVIKHCLRKSIALRESAAAVSAMQRDRLTGLYTREAFFDKVRQMVAARAPGYYIMSCFDIDKFKFINDQYGTAKGDEVLRHTAAVFRDGFEPNGGICSRISADNFAVIYPASFLGTPELEEIRERAAHVEGLVTPVIFSTGRYLIDNVDLLPAAMYDRATLATETVKGRFDTKIAQYSEAMRERLIREQEIVLEMEDALHERQFEVWFQPQYNHTTGAMIGAEALVRWRHPKKGLIPPFAFIPVFEQNGFIYSLDKFVWEEVCRYLQKWTQEGRAPLPVSVNISRYDVFCPDIIEVISGLVKKYDIPVDLLRLEITESAFAESTLQIVSTVKELIARGFTVVIDDFGSGYSSLNTLKDVPAQILKLDMKFLERGACGEDTLRGGNIVESVIRMTKWLGMSVIAEGVETIEQADFLRSVGCSYIQGYLYAKPMPADSYEEHCQGLKSEEMLLKLSTVENLDNNSFWDPKSMDTLIFNSYIGGACIFEYHKGRIELLRATEKYAQVIGSAGMTVDDALRLNWAEHLGEEGVMRVISDLDESAATRKEVTNEYVFLDLPGCPHETYLRSTVRVIASAGDRYLVYCTNENITAQRQSEKREREAAERLQSVLENVDLGIFAVVVESGTARCVFANDRYYDILGYTKEQFEKEIRSPYDIIAPEERQHVVDNTAQINSVGKSKTLEYTIITRDGRRRKIRSLLSVATLSGISEPVQLSTLRDITEEAATELRERTAASQIRAIMRDMPGGFVRMRVDPDGSIKPLYFNEGFLRLVGMNYDELMELYAEDAFAGVHPDDVKIVNRAISEMFRDGEARSSRYRLRHGNGGYVWLTIYGHVTRRPNGDIFLNIYYTDATELVRAEEQQRELLDNIPGGAALCEYDNGKLTVKHLNKRYWELIGREPKVGAELLPSFAAHPDDISLIMSEIEAAIAQNSDLACDIRLRHETAGYIMFRLIGRVVPAGNEKYAVYAIFAPISGESVSYHQMLPLLLSAMMTATSDLSFAKDRSFRYVAASRAFARIVGYENESDIVGKTDFDLFDRELAAKYRKDDEALLQAGNPIVDMREPIPSVDGTPHYSSTSKYPLRDGYGNIIGLYGVGRDVTRATLLDSQLRLVNDSIPGGLATHVCTPGSFSAENVRLTYYNDGFCRLFGFTREEYESRVSREPAVLIFDEDRYIIAEQWRALMEHDIPTNCLYRVHVKGGGYKWISHRSVAADRRDGKVVINSILQDITDQRELIEQLRISEEENSLAVQLGGSVICRYQIADRTLTLSPSDAASYSLPEVITNVPYEPVRLGLVSPESADAYTGFFDAISRGVKAATAIFQQKYFGAWRWLEAKSSTVFSDEGEPVKAVISFLDVTERLERENVYKKWQQSLEDRLSGSYSLLRCNLCSDEGFATTEGTLISFDFSSAGHSFNERERAYIRQCVFEEDADKYTALVNSDAMLAGYYRGKRSSMLEYRELLPSGNTRWLRLTIDLVEYPNSTEIEAYLMYENIDETKRAELQTKMLSETDPLTGVLNRAAFAARVEEIIRSSKPEARHAMLILDVDGFKKVNDVFGHAFGDQALIDLAGGLRTVIRHDDLVARLGGDEFLVFLSNIRDEHSAALKAEQICVLMKKSYSMEVQVSGSVGIAISPRDGMTYETLYKNADSALYFVKGSGKNHHAFFNESMADEHLIPELDDAPSGDATKAEKRRRMLIVDDGTLDHEQIQEIFQEEFIIEKARDGASALTRLRHYGSAVSVVLLDSATPNMSGFSVLEKMQSSADLRSIPVIIISESERRAACLRAVRQGAADFIIKPVEPELMRLRVQSAVSKSENERLRAKNCLLEMQNEERIRYESALDSAGVTFVEYNWLTGDFSYYPSISRYLLGTYDSRKFWQILLSDMVAETPVVQDMQQLTHRIAEDRSLTWGSRIVSLKTPKGDVHKFRMNVRKLANEYRLTNKLIIAFTDLDYDASEPL